MADLRARRRARDRRAAGVGEEIQHADGAPRIFDLLARKVPVHGLLGEEARVLEVHGLDLKRKVPVFHLPGFGQPVLVPVSAAGGRAVVAALRAAPAAVRVRRLPYRLRVRPHQDLLSPALQLFSAAAVQQFVIFPSVRDPHIVSPSPQGIVVHNNRVIILRPRGDSQCINRKRYFI